MVLGMVAVEIRSRIACYDLAGLLADLMINGLHTVEYWSGLLRRNNFGYEGRIGVLEYWSIDKNIEK